MSDIEWNLVHLPTEVLTSYHKNPRCISKTQLKHLAQNIDKFGLIDKPIVNLDNTIIGGHQRIELMRIWHEETVACWIPSRMLTDREVEELNYRLNENKGYFDYDILANKYEMADLLEWGENPLKAEEREPKMKKPKATLEFDSTSHLEQFTTDLQEISSKWQVKLKIKV